MKRRIEQLKDDEFNNDPNYFYPNKKNNWKGGTQIPKDQSHTQRNITPSQSEDLNNSVNGDEYPQNTDNILDEKTREEIKKALKERSNPRIKAFKELIVKWANEAEGEELEELMRKIVGSKAPAIINSLVKEIIDWVEEEGERTQLVVRSKVSAIINPLKERIIWWARERQGEGLKEVLASRVLVIIEPFKDDILKRVREAPETEIGSALASQAGVIIRPLKDDIIQWVMKASGERRERRKRKVAKCRCKKVIRALDAFLKQESEISTQDPIEDIRTNSNSNQGFFTFKHNLDELNSQVPTETFPLPLIYLFGNPVFSPEESLGHVNFMDQDQGQEIKNVKLDDLELDDEFWRLDFEDMVP